MAILIRLRSCSRGRTVPIVCQSQNATRLPYAPVCLLWKCRIHFKNRAVGHFPISAFIAIWKIGYLSGETSHNGFSSPSAGQGAIYRSLNSISAMQECTIRAFQI